MPSRWSRGKPTESGDFEHELSRINHSCPDIDEAKEAMEQVRLINHELRQLSQLAIDRLAELESDYADKEDALRQSNYSLEQKIQRILDLEEQIFELQQSASEARHAL